MCLVVLVAHAAATALPALNWVAAGALPAAAASSAALPPPRLLIVGDEGLLRCERASGARRDRPQAPHSCSCPAVGLSSFRRCGPVSHPRPVLQRGWGRGAHAGASEAGRLRDGFGRRRVACEQLRARQASIVIDARMASRAAPRGRTAARGGCGTASNHPLAFIARLACTRSVTKRAARRPFGSRLKQTVACGPARARADHADPDASAVPRRKTTRSLARRVGKHSVTRVHRHRTSPTCFGRYGPRRAPSCTRHGLDIR